MAKSLTPCLWFDREAEDAAKFYTSVFPNSKIVSTSYFGEAGPRDDDLVLTVEFELDGTPFVALNGGPDFTFSEAISFQIDCKDQDEVDHYWESAVRGRRGGPVRLAQGPLRAVVAGRAVAARRSCSRIRTRTR